MIPGSANPLLLKSAAAAGAYQVSRSLRFNSSDSAYLSRTPAVAGNRKTWTWAGWVKVSKQQEYPDQKGLFFAGSSTNNLFRIMFQGSNGQLRIDNEANGSNVTTLLTTQVFRDFSAWMHIVLAVDTTQATPSNRFKIYVNGTQVTTFSTATYQAQNTDTLINSTNAHSIGILTNHSPTYPFDGYLADIHFIDGQALTPSSFTEVSATTGQLIPKAYTGSFGTNGFWLKFSDNSAATAATLGKDYSGNSNNWTPNNLSVTAGAGNDSLVDTPTSYGTDTGVGGEVRGNYATLNPLQLGANITLSNGNLDGSQPSGAGTNTGVTGTIGLSSGKWYWETTVNTRPSGTYTLIGIASSAWRQASTLSFSDPVWIYYGAGTKQGNGSEVAYGASYGAGDVIGVAFDADNGTLTFYKNGVSQGTAFTGLTSGPYFPIVGKNEGACAWTWSCNFGQRAFAYQTPGTNRPAATFLALCDTNLGAPLVAKPNTVMDVLVFAATNANNTSITGLNFQPDLVWGKSRTNAYGHQLYDSVRGVNKSLKSNTTDAEGTDTNGVTSFDSNGFTAGVDFNAILGSGSSVAWCWDAGTSTVSNTQGSITSQVRANASAGFSVVTFTGTGAAATIGHGLGVAPKLLLVKSRSAAENWLVYHGSLSASSYLRLNTTDANLGPNNDVWNNTAPTSTVFSMALGATNNVTYVCYAFAPVVGYSSMGSYVGNGSSDGSFVYTGFRPRWILVKASSFTQGWALFDTARSTYNASSMVFLQPNTSNSEFTTDIDILSNGFKARANDGNMNGSGQTYIYYAVAENPFQYARAR